MRMKLDTLNIDEVKSIFLDEGLQYSDFFKYMEGRSVYFGENMKILICKLDLIKFMKKKQGVEFNNKNHRWI